MGDDIDAQLAAAHAHDIEVANRSELRKATALESRIRRYESRTAREPRPRTSRHRSSSRSRRARKTLPQHELVLLTGDWHTGARYQMHETGGVYEQDVATTRSQVERLWDRVQRLHAIQSAGINFTKLHIISLGDLIDNDDMRPAQHRAVEDVMTVQTVQAFDLFSWLCRQALTIFPEVEVEMVGGNHDRTGRNKGNAGLGELDYADTMSWLIGEFTKRQFADEPRITVRNWQTFFGYKHVAGKRLVFEHGSSFKWNANSYAGIPWYAVSMLPKRYADMLGKPDITVIGHGHRPAVLPDGRGWLVVNGALPATTQYEQSSFKTVHRPQQTLLSVHEKYGLTGWTPIYLDVEGTALPGDVWEDPDFYADRANHRPSSLDVR
jgi:predicted phosphodiesterase